MKTATVVGKDAYGDNFYLLSDFDGEVYVTWEYGYAGDIDFVETDSSGEMQGSILITQQADNPIEALEIRGYKFTKQVLEGVSNFNSRKIEE